MKRVAFIGPPNVGKSSLFARLGGVYSPIGNWAGLTVTVKQATVPWCGSMVELLDLPGFYALSGGGADEQLAQAMVEKADADVWVLVLNAVHLPRQLGLLNELLARQLPLVVLVNQIDEAKRLGVQVSVERMQQDLGIPVLAVSGKACIGMDTAQQMLCKQLQQPKTTTQTTHLPTGDWLTHIWQAPTILADSTSEKLDAILLHPVWGLPLFALAMTLMFQTVFWIGGTIQDSLAEVFSLVSETFLLPYTAHLPAWLSGFLINGVYEGIATLFSFVPLVALFFLLMAALTESGYLARMAFLADDLMSRFGLEGRSLVLTVMGMGCNVPAVLGARIIPNRRMRYLTQLTLPFSLCSARFQVFIFIAAALFAPWQAAFVVMGLYVLSLAATLVTAWIGQKAMAKGVYEPVVFEMPSYRIPSLSAAYRSAKHEVVEFMKRASALIVFGVVAVWMLLNFPWGVTAGDANSYAAVVGRTLAPIFDPMGLPELYVIALLFGLVAKEVVLGGLMLLMGIAQNATDSENALSAAINGNLPPDAALAMMAFILLYTPCLATLSVLKQEGGWRLMFTSLAWSFTLAWIVAVAIYQTARIFFH